MQLPSTRGRSPRNPSLIDLPCASKTCRNKNPSNVTNGITPYTTLRLSIFVRELVILRGRRCKQHLCRRNAFLSMPDIGLPNARSLFCISAAPTCTLCKFWNMHCWPQANCVVCVVPGLAVRDCNSLCTSFRCNSHHTLRKHQLPVQLP